MTLNQLSNIQIGVGVGSMVVGLLLIVGPGTGLFAAYESTIVRAAVADTQITGPVAAAGQATLIHWLLATCGAGVVGWAIAWIFIAHVPLRRGERWAYYCLLSSLLVWALLDLIIAWWFGVTGEIIFGFCAALAAGIPLALGRPRAPATVSPASEAIH